MSERGNCRVIGVGGGVGVGRAAVWWVPSQLCLVGLRCCARCVSSVPVLWPWHWAALSAVCVVVAGPCVVCFVPVLAGVE